MNLSRHQGLGTSGLISRSSHLILTSVLMNSVCTRDVADCGGGFLVLYVDDIPLIGTNDGKIVSSKSMVVLSV